MEYVFKMEHSRLGSFKLKEALVNTSDGMRACQDYGQNFAKELE